MLLIAGEWKSMVALIKAGTCWQLKLHHLHVGAGRQRQLPMKRQPLLRPGDGGGRGRGNGVPSEHALTTAANVDKKPEAATLRKNGWQINC